MFNIRYIFQNRIYLVDINFLVEFYYSWQHWPCDLAHPRLGLDWVEQGRDGEPDHGGEHESGQLVLDHAHLAAAVGDAGNVDKAGQEEQSPEPAAFHQPLIDKIVRIRKVAPEIDDLYQSQTNISNIEEHSEKWFLLSSSG